MRSLVTALAVGGVVALSAMAVPAPASADQPATALNRDHVVTVNHRHWHHHHRHWRHRHWRPYYRPPVVYYPAPAYYYPPPYYYYGPSIGFSIQGRG